MLLLEEILDLEDYFFELDLIGELLLEIWLKFERTASLYLYISSKSHFNFNSNILLNSGFYISMFLFD
jgi:hypothetical protein